MQKTIVITGGSGYIGSHVAFTLARLGYHIIVIDSLVHHKKVYQPWATVIVADCADPIVLDHVFTTYKVEAVVHCAAYTEVGISVQDPLRFYDNNVVVTINLLRAMMRNNIKKIVFSSSCAVYGLPLYTPIDEQHPRAPISPYGNTKLVVEMLLQDFAQAYGLHYVILRYFNAAGALAEHGLGEYHVPETHVLPLLLQAMLEQKPFYIFGDDYQTKDGTAVRDFLHVLDIASAHTLALKHLEKNLPSDIFNLGTGKGISVYELVRSAELVCNMPVKYYIQNARAGDPPILVADAAKAKNVLGWQAQNSTIEEIILSAYVALKNHDQKKCL